LSKRVLALVDKILNNNNKIYYDSETIENLFFQKTKINILKPFLYNQKLKLKNLKIINKWQKKLFKDFVSSLNKEFNASYSDRFWAILIGPWFHFALNNFYNRLNSIKGNLYNYKIQEIVVCSEVKDDTFSADNTIDFIINLNNPNWLAKTHIIIARYLNIKYKIKKDKKKYKKNNINILYFFLKKIKNLLFNLNFYFLKKNKSLIINTSLPKFSDYLFQLSMKNFPAFIFLDKFENKLKFKYNYSLRESLLQKYINSKDDMTIKCLKKLLVMSMPKSLLENFIYFSNFILKETFYKKIKFIFTSQNYDTNEYYKYLAAFASQNGCRIFYMQHGNNEGTSKFDYYKNPEDTADFIFTWGWKKNYKTIPLFNTKISGKKKFNKDSLTGSFLYFFSSPKPRKRFFWDTGLNYDLVYNNELFFIKNLSEQIHSSLILKLHTSQTSIYDENFKKFCNKINPKIIVTRNARPFEAMLNSKISIFSYDSTGLYEHLTMNHPCIAFSNTNFKEDIIQTAQIYYNYLKDAGILYDNPREAVDFVNKNWNRINDWWFSKNVQKNILKFVNKYSKYEKSPRKKLRSLLSKI